MQAQNRAALVRARSGGKRAALLERLMRLSGAKRHSCRVANPQTVRALLITFSEGVGGSLAPAGETRKKKCGANDNVDVGPGHTAAKKQAENAKQLSKSPVFKDMHKRTDRRLSQAIQDLQVQSEQARADRQ